MANDDETQRASRAAISKTRAVPEWLLRRFPLPENVHVHHTVHKDSTLPLFQGRLCGGEIYESKTLNLQHRLSCYMCLVACKIQR